MPAPPLRRAPRRLPRFSPAAVLAWLPALAVLAPVVIVIWRAAQPGGEFWGQVASERLPGYLLHTLILMAAVTGLAILFAVPAAWHVSVHHFPGRRIFEWLLLVPLAMPGFIAAAAYVDVLQQLVPFYVWVRKNFGIDAFLWTQQIAPWVFSVTVLAATLFPYVFLSCRAVFLRQAAGPLEAARLLGAGSFRTFCRIALPMARPAVAAGGSLVAMEAVNDFGVVTTFGINPLTPGIFRAWGEGNHVSAMRLAMILMALAMAGLWIERLQRGRRSFAADHGEAPLSRRKLSLPGALVALAACLIPLALGFFIPAVSLVRWTAQAWESMDWQGNLKAAVHSFSLAGGAALLIVAGGLILVAARRILAGRAASLLLAQRIGILGYAFPSALVAVGVGAWVSILAEHVPGGAALALSASVFGLLFAYFVRFLAVGIQPLAAGFDRVSASLHDAARTLGARPLAALWKVDLPLVWPALVAGAALAFIDVFKELTLTLVLRPFDFETLATRTYRLTGESRIPEAAAPALFMVLLCLVGLIPLTRLLRRAAP